MPISSIKAKNVPKESIEFYKTLKITENKQFKHE